jgi:hypothetical protein
MKNGRFSDAQIMGVLKQAEGGAPVSELCREHGMSSASFYQDPFHGGACFRLPVSPTAHARCV